jgi:hypothetical protein
LPRLALQELVESTLAAIKAAARMLGGQQLDKNRH